MNRKAFVCFLFAGFASAATMADAHHLKGVGRQTGPQADKSLWYITDLPRVGTIVQVTYHHNDVVGVDPITNYVADNIKPDVAQIGDASSEIKSNASVSLAASFLGATAKASIGSAKTLKLKITNTRVEQTGPSKTYIYAVRALAGKAKDSDGDIFSNIAKDGRKPKLWQYWMITKVFTAASIDYETGSKGGPSGELGCSAAPCTAELGDTASAKIDLSKDSSGVYTGKNRPIFVVIKPIRNDSRGLLWLDQSVSGPDIISSN